MALADKKHCQGDTEDSDEDEADGYGWLLYAE